MEINAFQLAQRFIGIKETPGNMSNAQVLAMLRLDNAWPQGDDVPWCSAFANYIAWLLRLPRSKDLRARSWLKVGTPINITEAKAENDIVVIKRGGTDQPGPDVIDAPGHVGFFAGVNDSTTILILGGNQGDEVNISTFPMSRLLGIRRLA
jgi:uncharacterized protein (TIGR02594 family)